MGSKKLNFQHILFMSTATKRSQGLARAMQEYLREPRFSYLNPDVESYPDRLFSWSDIDLMMVDLSKNRAPIYKWYLDIGRRDFMPPVIFLAHPASYSDAGSFYRAGASNYLELRGLKKSDLIRSLSIAEKSMPEHRQAVYEKQQPEPPVASDNPFSLKGILPEEMISSQPKTSSRDADSKEPSADFINTGIMKILDRDALKKTNQK